MQNEILKVDGREIVIRPMDDAHIISECAHQRAEGRTSKTFRRFHAEIKRRYGNAGIVALCGAKVVGFVNFYPAVLNTRLKAPLCAEVDQGNLETAFEQMEWPSERGDTLSISCVNLDKDLTRKGIGSRLVHMTIEWARENQYERIHAGANDTQWWAPCKGFYENLGFHVKETVEFGEPRGDGEVREHVMELLLTDPSSQ